jgi:hypothetical protein
VGLVALGLIGATTVNLFRTGGAGALNSIWIEDAAVFLDDSYHRHFLTDLRTPWWGYYHTLPRIAARIASAFPVDYAPAVLSIEAAVAWGAVAVIAFVASRPFLPDWRLRLLVAAPVVLIPVGHTQVDNDVATVHFVALYGIFWLLLWQPRTRTGTILSVVIAALFALSDMLAVVFIPLALLRLVGVRGVRQRLVSLSFLAGAAVQLFGLATGSLNRGEGITNGDPLWALGQYAVYLLPRAVFGDAWLGGSDVDVNGFPLPGCCRPTSGETALIVVALVLLAAATACAFVGLTHPHWILAITASAFSVAIFLEEVMVSGLPYPRYLVAPVLLCYVALVALLRPNGRSVASDAPRHAVPLRLVQWSALPVLVFALLFGVAAVDNYRVTNGRSTSPAWSDAVAQGRELCRRSPDLHQYTYRMYWWSLIIPCDRLR